jgi:hypothetical protein
MQEYVRTSTNHLDVHSVRATQKRPLLADDRFAEEVAQTEVNDFARETRAKCNMALFAAMVREAGHEEVFACHHAAKVAGVRNVHTHTQAQHATCRATHRFMPSPIPPAVVVSISTPSVMKIIAPVSARKHCSGSSLICSRSTQTQLRQLLCSPQKSARTLVLRAPLANHGPRWT